MGEIARKAEDIAHVLRDRVALLPGSRDIGGRPLIVFPARESSTNVNADDLRYLLLYLHAVTADDTKEQGFVILIDMRKGTTWSHVKPILKALHDHFPAIIRLVLIIKPDNFWEKQKTSFISSGSAKYKFEVQMISVDNLPRFIDPRQLTAEFGGLLHYDHDDWLETRLELERVIWQMSDLLRNFEQIKDDMKNGQLPVDVATAETANEQHKNLKSRLQATTIEQLEIQSRKIHDRIMGNCHTPDDGYGSSGREATVNPDLASTLPHLSSLIESLGKARNELFIQFDMRKQKLDHCYRLKLFEQDAEKMFEWIRSHSTLLAQRNSEIGDSASSAHSLLREHRDFNGAAINMEVNVNHVINVARQLMEKGNYGRNKIEKDVIRLESEWQRFRSALENRTRLLTLSQSFNEKAEYYLSHFNGWLRTVQSYENNTTTGMSADQLEMAISEHTNMTDLIVHAYSEAISDGRLLCSFLKKQNGDIEKSNNQSCGDSPHVHVIQHLLRAHREIAGYCEARKLRLHSRLALIAFKNDAHLVLQWLDQHGDAYLRKNTSIGQNLTQARQLLRNHNTFRNVAGNTYSNAEKLFIASKTIIESGECDEAVMSGEVEELRARIAAFSHRVEARSDLLNKSVLVHTHYMELSEWYQQMDAKEGEYEMVAASVEECERKKELWMIESDATVQAYGTTIGEGEMLLAALVHQAQLMGTENRDSCVMVQRLMDDIKCRHERLVKRWQLQRLCLQLGYRFALFVNNCREICAQLKSWQEDMEAMCEALGHHQAEAVLPYHQDNTTKVKNAILEIMNSAIELTQVVDGAIGSRLVAHDGRPLKEAIGEMAMHVRRTETKVMQVADKTQHRIEQAVQLCRMRVLATQAVTAIEREEAHLVSALGHIPTNLDEALTAQHQHKLFQQDVEAVNPIYNAFYQRAEALCATANVNEQRAIAELYEPVSRRWRHLVGLTEERNKLIKAAVACYKSLHQGVIPVLDQLERDYGDEKDWCSEQNGAPSASGKLESAAERTEFVAELLSRHRDNKERFLKGCTYAQKNAELFLKYVRRSTDPSGQCGHVETSNLQQEINLVNMMNDLRDRQSLILELWNRKKSQLDRCQEFVLLEATARQNLEWIHREGEAYLAKCDTRKIREANRDQLEAWQQENSSFKMIAKQQRAKVKTMLAIAENALGSNDSTGSNGDVPPLVQYTHSNDIGKWMTSVRQRFEHFSQRLAESENRLSQALGSTLNHSDTREDLSLDRVSDPNLEVKLRIPRVDNESSRKMREPMLELVKSERNYIEDLRICIEVYMGDYRKSGDAVPLCIRDKEKAIFGNIEQLYQFHNQKFLQDLLKYERNPEDVGYCFISWVERLNNLYTDYCLNKEQNNHIIAIPEAVQFFSKIRAAHNLEQNRQDLQSFVIKPVQRITRYQLMLKNLLEHCQNSSREEIKEAYDIVLSVPRRANDFSHLQNLDTSHKDLGVLGEFVMQDAFTVWDPKQLIKKGRERQVFLYELCIVFSKRVELPAKGLRYVYKNHLMLAEVNICEHVEGGDPSKLALWQGEKAVNEIRTVLKASSEQTKVVWVKKLRQLKHDLTIRAFRMPPLDLYKSNRSSDHRMSNNESGGTPSDDRSSMHSIASTSSATQNEQWTAIEDFTPTASGQLRLKKGDVVEVVERPTETPDWLLVSRLGGGDEERGFVPIAVLVLTDDGAASCSSTTDRPQLVDNNIKEQVIVKRKSIRRFFPGSSSSSSRQPKAQTTTTTTTNSHHHNQSPAVISGAVLSSAASLSSDQNHALSTVSVDPGPSRPLASQPIQSSVASSLADCGDFAALPPPMNDIDTEKITVFNSTIITTTTTIPPTASEVSMDESATGFSDLRLNSQDELPVDNRIIPPTAPLSDSPEDQARFKRQYLLIELVETERNYVGQLSSVVNDYMANLQTMELPDDLKGKDKIIFANVAQILDFHKTMFLIEIEKCLTNYESAGNAFIKYERRLHTYYVKYCQNKPKSDYLVGQEAFEQFFAETKLKLGQKVTLSDLLIKPVQRMMMYQLLLKDVTKYSERAGDRLDLLNKAMEVMQVVAKACDDMMQVGRLQNFDGNLNAQGKLLFQGNLQISDNSPNQPFKGKDRRVFLFEQSCIIADDIPPKKEFGNHTYIFKNQIMVNKMILDPENQDESFRFIVRSSDPSQPGAFLAQANSAEEKQQWLVMINSQLDQQKTLLAALVDPKKYQSQLASANPFDDGSSVDKKTTKSPMFNRLAGGKITTTTSSSSPAAATPSVTSPMAAQSTSKSSKLFGFGKKSSSGPKSSPPTVNKTK